MSILVWSNNANSTIAAALAPGSTTITLATGTGALFPPLSAGQYFVGSLTDAATQTLHEIVWVTAISGDTLTVTRGQESTTARSWSFGDVFAHQLTAGQMRALNQNGLTAQTRFVSNQAAGVNNNSGYAILYTTLQSVPFTFPSAPAGTLFRLHVTSQVLFGGSASSGSYCYGQLRMRVVDTTNGVDLVMVCGHPVVGSNAAASFMVSQSEIAGSHSDLENELDGSATPPPSGTAATTRLYAQGTTISIDQRAALANTGALPIPSATLQGILVLTASPA